MEVYGDAKIEKANKCLSVLEILKQQLALLKTLGLADAEKQFAQVSSAHIDRLQSCLENLLSEIKKSAAIDQKHRISRKGPITIKP